MNYPNAAARIPKSCALRLLGATLAVCSINMAAAQSVEAKRPTVMDSLVVDATKTDVLFRGCDISVSLDKDLYPVRDVDGSKWVIQTNGQDKVISAKRAPIDLKVSSTLKLTEVSARIEGFTRTPGYTFDNDPVVIQSRALMKAATTNAMLQGVAQDARDLSDTLGNAALGAAAIFASGDKQFGDAALMHTAEVTPAITHPTKVAKGQNFPAPNTLVPTIFDGADGFGVAKMEAAKAQRVAEGNTMSASEPLGRMTTQGFDAMDVGFSISSAQPLYNPYVVTITRFREENSKPGTVKTLIFAKALNPIDSHPSRVHFSEDGFPFDYELIDFQVHIYDGGVEVATNLSQGRVDMTRDEAFQFVKMEYIGAHKGATLPPAPAMGKLPAELPTRLAAGNYDQTFFVKVSSDGFGEDSFADARCSKKIEDPFLDSVVRSLRFKPALANGAPVQGVAALNLTKLQI